MDNNEKQKQSDDLLISLANEIVNEELRNRDKTNLTKRSKDLLISLGNEIVNEKLRNRDKIDLTKREFYVFVFSIIIAIAFLETSGPIWAPEFWREFLLNVLGFSIVSIFAGAGGVAAVNGIIDLFQKKK